MNNYNENFGEILNETNYQTILRNDYFFFKNIIVYENNELIIPNFVIYSPKIILKRVYDFFKNIQKKYFFINNENQIVSFFEKISNINNEFFEFLTKNYNHCEIFYEYKYVVEFIKYKFNLLNYEEKNFFYNNENNFTKCIFYVNKHYKQTKKIFFLYDLNCKFKFSNEENEFKLIEKIDE